MLCKWRQTDHLPVVPNALEQVERLAQPILCGVLAQHHVVAGASRHEDDGGNIIEALDPLASLVALTAHVEHAARFGRPQRFSSNCINHQRLAMRLYSLKVNFIHLKPRLENARGENTTAQNVLLGWRVVGLFNDAYAVQETGRRM